MICKVTVKLMDTDTDHPMWCASTLRVHDERRGPARIYIKSMRTTIPTKALGTINTNLRNEDPAGLIMYFTFCEEADVTECITKLKLHIRKCVEDMQLAAQSKLAYINSNDLTVNDIVDIVGDDN